MDRIRSLVATARRRLLMEAWLSYALQAGVIVAALLLVLILERRITGASGKLGVPSGWDGVAIWVAIALGAFAVAAAFGAWRARRAVRNEASAALELDARLVSGERFTTALELENDPDPFAKAAVADAVQYATTPAVAEAVRERFAVKPPHRWWLTPTILTVAAIAWFILPQYSLFGVKEAQADSADASAQAVKPPETQRLEAVVNSIKENPELSAKLKAELDKAKHTLDENADSRKPEDRARESLRRVAELQQRLDELKGSKESKASEALKEALSKLDMPKEQNSAADLANALKRGDFKEAQKAVEDLKKAMKEGNLSQEQRDALSAALDKTAKQLETLAKDPQKLADALKNAGMDQALAQNPEALKQAIQQSQSLNQTQKEALQKMSESLQQCQNQLGQMSQQMNKMASQCKNPGQNQGQNPGQSPGKNAGQKNGQGEQANAQGQGQKGQQGQEAGEQMSQMLSEQEAAEQMSKACQNASSQCSGSSSGMSESECDSALKSSCRGGESSCSSDSVSQKDNNSGGRGVAGGGNRESKKTAFGTKEHQQKGARGEGDIIARQLVQGESPVGENLVKLEAVATKIATSAEKGSEDDPIPPHLQEVSKQYFGKLNQVMQAKGVKAATPNAAPAAPAPAAPAAPAGDKK